MKRLVLTWVFGSLLAATAVAAAQDESLGEVARQHRKAKKPAPVKVYDNDNLPTSAAISMIGTASAPNDATTSKKEEKEQAERQADRKKLQEQLRTDIDAQQKKVADITHEIDLLQREQRLRTAVYYADAGTQLRDSKRWADEELQFQASTNAKQQELQAARTRLDDLQEAARKAGMPSR